MSNLRLEHNRCNMAAGARQDPPRARIARPTLVVLALVAMAAFSVGHVSAFGPSSDEQLLRARLTSCAILEEASERGIDPTRLRSTRISCALAR